ncbi:MAG: 3-phosphoshikimate 1-carboxyvinyltransferase, partial [Lachnospiraceae bacterium]|nr:3-phosphoshikimate 1-carboxyvinyltransferase [Lachnospiraceae bacterium]
MKVTIKRSKAKGMITAPPSKSILHRYIIGASLSEGQSIINNVDLSKDIEASLRCVGALGAKTFVEGKKITVTGMDRNGIAGPVRFDCNESGSTMRFFMGIAMGLGCDSAFYGSDTLLGRPMGIYEDICSRQGILFERHSDHIRIFGKLKPGTFEVPGNISSQFITGLLFALPMLDKESFIRVIPPVESGSYIDLTLDALGQFGIEV